MRVLLAGCSLSYSVKVSNWNKSTCRALGAAGWARGLTFLFSRLLSRSGVVCMKRIKSIGRGIVVRGFGGVVVSGRTAAGCAAVELSGDRRPVPARSVSGRLLRVLRSPGR